MNKKGQKLWKIYADIFAAMHIYGGMGKSQKQIMTKMEPCHINSIYQSPIILGWWTAITILLHTCSIIIRKEVVLSVHRKPLKAVGMNLFNYVLGYWVYYNWYIIPETAPGTL